MAPFYEWGSTASRPEPLRGGSLLFTTKFPELLLLILSTSERWKAESSLELSHPWSHPVVSNTEPLDWEYSTLTSRSCSIKPLALSCIMWKNGQAYLNKLAVFTPQNFKIMFGLCGESRILIAVTHQLNSKSPAVKQLFPINTPLSFSFLSKHYEQYSIFSTICGLIFFVCVKKLYGSRSLNPQKEYVMRCMIWLHLYNLKNLKNTNEWVLLLSTLLQFY